MNMYGSGWIRPAIRLLFILTLAACVPAFPTTTPLPTTTQPPARTIPVPPTRTAIAATSTARPTAQPSLLSGSEITFQDVQFSLPAKLESKVQPQAVPPMDILGEVYPSSTQFTFVGYRSQNTLLKPQIQVYPIRALGPSATQAAQELKDLLSKKPGSPERGIPILPIVPAGQLIDVQIKYLTFANGSGIRVLTQFAQGSWPINNEGLVYIFQGLTSDDHYYISASFPITASFLPDHVDDPAQVPAVDGISYPDFNSADFDAEYASYQRAVIHKLNTTPDDQYAPDLGLLDELIISLKVNSVIEAGKSATVPCVNGLPTRLHVDGFAYVNPDPPLPNNLRKEAGQKKSLIGDIQPGQAMKILEGPKCVDGWVWWKVRTFEPELVGWTAEGDQKNYWLIPCESRSQCGP